MPRRSSTPLAVFMLALSALCGCATSSAVATGETVSVQLQVDNNLRGITGVSVYLLSDTGTRRSLGPVESNRQATYTRTMRAGDYQLIAARVGAEDIVSERFRVDADVVVIWSLAQNQLTFGER
ncbi:MAG: hypothetical protein ACREK1_03215 [Longimicrobiales bacterium]